MSGTRNPRAKLTPEQVQEIKVLIANGHTNVALAAQYGVSHDLIEPDPARQSMDRIADQGPPERARTGSAYH